MISHATKRMFYRMTLLNVNTESCPQEAKGEGLWTFRRCEVQWRSVSPGPPGLQPRMFYD